MNRQFLINNIIAVCISGVGSLFTALSLAFWKKASMVFDKKIQDQALELDIDDNGHVVYPKRCLPQSVFLTPYWILGFVCVVLSLVINSVSMCYGSVMLLSSLSVVTIMMSSFITPCFFDERLGWYKDGFCSLVLCGGCILSIVQSPITAPYDREGIA